jgi:hypothetical protein
VELKSARIEHRPLYLFIRKERLVGHHNPWHTAAQAASARMTASTRVPRGTARTASQARAGHRPAPRTHAEPDMHDSRPHTSYGAEPSIPESAWPAPDTLAETW